MVRNVPFDTAGDPGPDQSDQGGLDDVLAIEEVIAVGLVDGLEEPSADLRQDANLDIFVLEIDELVALVDLLAGQRVVKRIGIDPSLGALRLPPEEEHRALLRRTGQVGGDHGVLLVDLDRGGLGRGRAERTQKPEPPESSSGH